MPTPFATRVLEVVRRIPKGQVMTYQEVARAAGAPSAYRAVGNILKQNHNPHIPCHRIVRSDGKPGGYNRGKKEKIRLLQAEGVRIHYFHDRGRSKAAITR